jgi:hypothetical protein
VKLSTVDAAAVEGSITSNGEAGIRPQRHMVGGLPDYGDEHHAATVGVLPRMGGRRHDRSCMGRRSDVEVVRPWHRKDRQGIARAVDHTHQALPYDHAVGNVHNLLHAYHRTRAAECGGGSHRDVGCSHEGDHGGHSSHRTEQVGSHHRHYGGPLANESGTYHGRDHQVHQGLHREP